MHQRRVLPGHSEVECRTGSYYNLMLELRLSIEAQARRAARSGSYVTGV